MNSSVESRITRSRAAGQQGFAVPGVMFILMGMMAILAVGATATVNTQRGTARDAESKSALVVAESGVEAALFRYANDKITESTPCIYDDGLGTTDSGGEWCTGVTDQTGEGSFTYYVKPVVTETETTYEFTIDVVSVGTADGISRVIRTTANPVLAVDPKPIFLTETIVAESRMSLDPGVDIIGSVGSNGSISIGDSTSVCGEIRYGDETQATATELEGAQQNCGDETVNPEPPYQKTYDLEEVTLPEDMTSSDWDANNVTLGNIAGSYWDADNRVLHVNDSNTTLTIDDPGPYLICRLQLDGQSVLEFSASVEAHFYFDDPANCPVLDSHTRDFTASGEQITGAYEQMLLDRGNVTVGTDEPVPIFYFLGSDTSETVADVNTNSGSAGEFRGVIYAPKTHIINSKGGLRVFGAVVGKTVSVKSGGDVSETVIEGGDFQIGIDDSIYTVFDREGFRECPAAAATSDTPYSECGP